MGYRLCYVIVWRENELIFWIVVSFFCMFLIHHFFYSLSFLLNVFRKQCIQTYNVYDFLTEVVSKVPDIGPSDVIADDKLGKRR